MVEVIQNVPDMSLPRAQIYLTPATALDFTDSDSSEDNVETSSILTLKESKVKTPESPFHLLEPPAKKRCKIRTVWQCINPLCSESSKSSLPYTASSYLKSYYNVKSDPRIKRKVCSKCRSLANAKLSNMKQSIEKNESSMLEKLPVARDMVLLDDSDEDLKTDSSDESEFEIEGNLSEFVESSITTFKLKDQITMGISYLSEKLNSELQNLQSIDKDFNDLEKSIGTLYNNLYLDFKPKIKELPSIDLNETNSDVLSGDSKSLPPSGPLFRPQIRVGDKAYAMRGNILSEWKLGIVKKVDGNICKLRFGTHTKVLSKRHIAYYNPCPTRLPVGTRIIGIYKIDLAGSKSEFYSGVIVEPPKVMNDFRYLIFFDDGYSSYVHHFSIRLVALQSSPEVWDDVHPNSKEFLQQYLKQYPERPMVKLSVNQTVWTEWDGKWWATKVLSVDASLVRLHFKDNGRVESVYRGSPRLSPLFKEMQQKKQKKDTFISQRKHPFKKKNSPYIEYTRNNDENGSNVLVPRLIKKAVARKSTSQISELPKKAEEVKIRWEYKGEINKTNLPDRIKPRKFISHLCTSACHQEENKYLAEVHLKQYNLLLIPIALGWTRVLTRQQNLGSRKICYISPCGRRLRNMRDLHNYLRITKSSMEVDFFTYEWWIHVYDEFKPSKEMCSIKDLSYGKENMPISCVNSLDNNFPEYVEYSVDRIPQSDVNLNLDDNFLVCCDCEDDCSDKSKCNCWQLTIQSTLAGPENTVNHAAGYFYKRLLDVVPTGIYECNSKCKCAKTCLNRVAQFPLKTKLQVFKTEKRGWGIRTLTDIPSGGFVCVYVGNLYTNEEANKVGQNFGDEYFAELDLIETIEGRKEGYESDVEDYDEDVEILSNFSESNDSEKEEEKEDMIQKDDRWNKKSTNGNYSLRKKENDATMTSNGDEFVKHTSARKYFGKDEDVYIMDAKTIGNVGRYLNHSCNPNIFVQNCFVDTHDLRYPWIAFFASTFIKAGSELCWDYCYIVDQVEGKEIYCECGADNCRGRLL